MRKNLRKKLWRLSLKIEIDEQRESHEHGQAIDEGSALEMLLSNKILRFQCYLW